MNSKVINDINHNEDRSFFESFTFNNLTDSINNANEHGCGCYYSKSLKDHSNGIYYYIDDYNDYSYVKFNSIFHQFTFVKADNKDATKKGFVKSKYEDIYVLDVVKTPHFKDNQFDYTEANLSLKNIKTGKLTKIKLYGYCGC